MIVIFFFSIEPCLNTHEYSESLVLKVELSHVKPILPLVNVIQEY